MAEREGTAAAGESAGARGLLVALAALVLPGAGHFLLGRRGRAAAFFLLVMTAVVIGCIFDGNLYRVVPRQPLSILGTLAAMGMGAPYFVLRWGLHYQGLITQPGYEYGTTFLLTAGLMNLLLVLDAWDIVHGRKD